MAIDFELDGYDRWRIKRTPGPFQGVRYIEVEARDTGAYSGGETEGRWFTVIPETHVRWLSAQDVETLKALVEHPLMDASQSDLRLATLLVEVSS